VTGAVGLGSDAAGEGLWDRREVPQAFFMSAILFFVKEGLRRSDMNDISKELTIDCRHEEQRIIDFARQAIARLHKKGAVIGLSGGLDSSLCAWLLEKALGRKKILALLLPERDSSPVHHRHARMVADSLGLKTIEIDMTRTLEDIGVYGIGPEKVRNEAEYAREIKRRMERNARGFGYHTYLSDVMGAAGGSRTSRMWKVAKRMIPKEAKAAFMFTKVRLRMLYLYFYAWQYDYAVVGTTDKSEYTTGIYDPHGDGANDITLLRHLYKTQIRQLAEHVGLPEDIIRKPHTADLYGNIPHETTLGISYEQLDTLLHAMSKGLPVDRLAGIASRGDLENVKKCVENARLARSLPLSLD
jgi:NAD+ synthase